MITQVSIRNFRSIANVDLGSSAITVLVGANDAGKSNILRALNLFFNAHTDPGVELNFASDFNQFGRVGKRKAKEIIVSVTFKLPITYRRKGLPDEVIWTKAWREGSALPREQTRCYVGGRRFPPRSRIELLLDNIRFSYIPAVKDRAFFADLQGQLYDILSSVAAAPLRDSATIFEKQLQTQLSGLLESIASVFDGTSVMRLPDNLREIFENLEISSDGIPLSRRGDGIKIRHIPMLLSFISKKQDEILNRGGIRFTHIWGFEEPENSVEMSACFKMADNLVNSILDSTNYQLFITTHSPVFYRINTLPGCSEFKTMFVEKGAEGQTSVYLQNDEAVDEVMGLMPLVSPYVLEEKRRYEILQRQFARDREIARKNKPTLLVEGIIDVIVLRKAFAVFEPSKKDSLHITDGDDDEDYGSAAAVTSRALAWALEMRHRSHASRTKALALYDSDEAGNFQKQKLSEIIQKISIDTKGILSFKSIPIPHHFVPLRKSGINIPVNLESCLSDEIWLLAKSKRWLEPVENPGAMLSKQLVNEMLSSKTSPFDILSDIEEIRILYCFKKNNKQRVASYVKQLSPSKASSALSDFRPIVDLIAKELGI